MRGPNSSEDRLLAESCTSLIILIPVALLILAYCCHPFWRKLLRSLCERHRRMMQGVDSIPEINVLEGDPTLVLLPSGRVVVLERPRRPTPIPPDFSSLDIHELEAGRLSLGPGDASSQGSKDNLQSPVQDYLPPPSYESIFGHPISNPALGVANPPSYTDAVSNVTFHLPESAV
ncbi:uncharacterized protein LOC103516570 isoform X3 [Diaphorina citri]|nr:uncharacterized protein LOC103516570 isoform X3 [Diaphorina citri]